MSEKTKPIISIFSKLAEGKRKTLLGALRNEDYTIAQRYTTFLKGLSAMCKTIGDKTVLETFRYVTMSDEEIQQLLVDLSPNEEAPIIGDAQLHFIAENVYRNCKGKFRLIPPKGFEVGVDDIPLEGLEIDEDIIEAQIGEEAFEFLEQQAYYPPYIGKLDQIAPNLQLMKATSTFSANSKKGFYIKDNRIYRNIACEINRYTSVKPNELDLKRILFLMFLMSGATKENFNALYKVVHNMVTQPESSVGTILYINDFDCGGNGKSKFVKVLENIFGDAFSAFGVQQLRFTNSLLGKRLISISEFEDCKAMKELIAMIKSMTGRDTFQYEGKGVDPISAPSYQNFIISSNSYIYFDDNGLKRRLQNFNVCNLLHILYADYGKDISCLNNLFGRAENDSARKVVEGMGCALYTKLVTDKNVYSIKQRDQLTILNSLKNPILRELFDNPDYDLFTHEANGITYLDLQRLYSDTHVEPAAYNYACMRIKEWVGDKLTLDIPRSCKMIRVNRPINEVQRIFKETLTALDDNSTKMRDKKTCILEKCSIFGFDTKELFNEFFGKFCAEKNVNIEETDSHLIIRG